jgi:phosphoenolpyruvate synthase/pyruvate phosphate dikinase
MDCLEPNTGLCDLLNASDEFAVKAAVHYFREHKWDYLADRILSDYSADFGVIRPLRDVWIKLLNFDYVKFIEFYESIYRFRKTPRYEDIFITVLLSIATGIAANEIHEQFKIWRRRNKETHEKFDNSGEVLIQYLMKINALREAYLFGELSFEEFNNLRDALKGELIYKNNNMNEKSRESLLKLWERHINKHQLTTNIDPIEELTRFVRLYYYRSKPRIDSNQDDNIHKDLLENDLGSRLRVTLNGLIANPGFAFGFIKKVNSALDNEKVYFGDIGVFRYVVPDMIPALKRCGGAIGLRESGGMAGHLAIVSRELRIPCVTRCTYTKFRDGQLVFLNASRGELEFILSTDYLKNNYSELVATQEKQNQ